MCTNHSRTPTVHRLLCGKDSYFLFDEGTDGSVVNENENVMNTSANCKWQWQ
jgi:hypothetical protein